MKGPIRQRKKKKDENGKVVPIAEPGAGGDYKYLRGFDPEPTFSLHYLQDPRLAQAVARFLEGEREEAASVINHLREQSVFKGVD